MTEMNPSLGWERLSDVFYRSRQLGVWDWSHNKELIQTFSTTLCALCFDQKIHCYNYNGELIWQLDVNNLPSKIVTFCFDEDERFILVLQDRIRKVDGWFPLISKDAKLPEEIGDIIWDYKNGIVVLQSSQDIYRYYDDSFDLLCKNEDRFTLATKHHWYAQKDLVVLLGNKTVFHLTVSTKSFEKAISGSSWQTVKISPKGFVCLFNFRLSNLAIYKSPSKFLLEQTLEENPDIIAWCGNDTVAYCSHGGGEVKLIGPQGSYITFWYPDMIIDLRTEIDGLKVLTSSATNFISKVEKYTSKIFSIGSTESSAILLDSLELLSNHAPKAIENLKVINLEQAVLECTLAARDEFSPYWQKRLLSAASFGKDSLSSDSFDPKVFVDTCNLLRVLNTLSQLGLSITAKQLDGFTVDGILSRLLRLRKFHKCIQICNFLKHHNRLADIFQEWALAKIKLSPELEDMQLYLVIKNQAARQTVAPPMINIARTAFLEGRFELAKNLTLDSTHPKQKLQLLLDMDEVELALIEAVKTNDPTLILTLLLILRDKLTVAQFTKILMLVMKENQLMLFYERNNWKFLYDFYRQTDKFQELAQVLFEEGQKNNELSSYFPQIINLLGFVVDNPLVSENKELLTRYNSLYEYQHELTTLFHRDFNNMTMDNTLTTLIEMGQERHVVKLVKTFKLSDRKFYQIKCKTLCKLGRFEELFNFAKEKKSPIGYMPFYEGTFKMGHKKEAAVYIDMITGLSAQKKIDMYLDCGSYCDAIQIASKEKDINALKRIKKLIPDNQPQLTVILREAMGKL
ncbi:HHL192Cp [Eremothecium sinecaudum]|uniref:Probable vacuolar protein sorting-associated protein 16 homolog n=1 Tax=Eremothecium sinecaudum TaxID=45286 RepID=A0A120K2T7_9SACH|nr:HHL192Cp [Eremothecium sinecaudum]AMD22578.1 HHL192Cp [Eremothecium sinecaudum]